MDDAAIALDKPVNTHDQQATTQPAQDTPGNPKCSDGEVSIETYIYRSWLVPRVRLC